MVDQAAMRDEVGGFTSEAGALHNTIFNTLDSLPVQPINSSMPFPETLFFNPSLQFSARNTLSMVGTCPNPVLVSAFWKAARSSCHGAISSSFADVRFKAVLVAS